MPAMPVTTPKWTGLPVTPVLRPVADRRSQRSRRLSLGERVRRANSPPTVSYYSLYAVGTRQNRPNRPGKYRFYLAHDWHSFDLKNGEYTVQVLATDSAGNHVRYASRFVVSN